MISMQLQRLVLTIFTSCVLLSMHGVHGITSNYATSQVKILSLQAKQTKLQTKLAHCDGVGKAEPGCATAARHEIDSSLNETNIEIANLQVAAKAAAKNERASVWNEKQRRFISGRLSIDDALKKNLGSITLDGAIVFFESDGAFSEWHALSNPVDPLTAKIEYASGKSPYIKSCLASTAASKRKRHVVARFSDPTCSIYASEADYQISKTATLIQIDMTRKLVYKGTRNNFQLVKQKLEDVQGCIRSVYANQGVRFNFNYSFESSGVLWNSSSEEIYVYDDFPHSNQTHWGILSEQGTPNSINYLCSSIAHELGHHLGLLDTYVDEKCPNSRRHGSRQELMANSNGHPALVRINEAEMKQILEPLCGEKPDSFFYADADSPGYDVKSSAFVSVGLGVQKFTTPVSDFGYMISAGITSVSKENGFAELQLNYAQPGLNLTSSEFIQDNFHFGYSQAILHIGSFLGGTSFVHPYRGQGTGNPFLAFYFGVGLHVWNFSKEAQQKVTGNNSFVSNKLYPNNQTAWVLDAGLSFFVIRELQVRVQYLAILMATKPSYQTVTLMVQYNIF